ncbi:Zn(II)2Cys6 transcription factor [Aspergillus luchuensis]|uniref:Uncharacterized protein n=1 Tax=Aspergillus kawachii TaxID=1069201 RepID=A0A7R7X6Z9_ASPKA|nr:uncharacterized protein AKAW2_80006A [Aspergillus luchuensis]BCS04205.1 hypothetical protein AKAW2_80006A [Aspergillus luchuensis]BCS15799.1 hypothetical protein ALUC_80006A [Aspergillus luchuensis]
MNVGGDSSSQRSTTRGSATGKSRRRIRPSRSRGLRTKTGCLTCRERRVKCDDGKPTCLRCSKSARICRYASDATQHSDQRHAATAAAPPAADREPTRAHLSPKGTGRQEIRAEDNRASNPYAVEKNSPRPQEHHSNVAAALTSHPTAPAIPEAAVPLHPDGSIESPHFDPLHEHNEQRLPSLDPAFPTSPVSLSQISLLNISPLEWYDLLARDAINHIQRLNDTSSGDPRWRFPEIALSRRQSPALEHPGARLQQKARYNEQQGHALTHGDGHTGSPLPDYQQLSQPWNTTSRLELSPTDLTFFQYYIEVVGPILDLFDPAHHFSNVVPHLALRNTGLLKSILAVGAKHMSLCLQHRGDGDAADGHVAGTPASLPGTVLSTESDSAPTHMATQYYYETLHYLSQTLLYPSYADSHEILATATMISTYEMFDADSAANSSVWEQHLRGSFWIQRSQDNDGESADGLRQAVWWAWLRQDIWAAFQAGRPTITFWRARKPLEELSSDELATRIVYLCGKCVKYAASAAIPPHQDPRERIEQGDRLLSALDEWHHILPASYQPVAVAGGGGSSVVFPPIWIHPRNHAGAMQMYHFAKATVLLNQPTLGGLNAYLLRDKQLTESVKMVCGIANSCQEHDCAMAFINVQALFGVGQFVRSPEMREELLRILDNMLRISKFPAKGLVARLQRVWQE